MFGTFFLMTQYFQLVLGYGTLEAGWKQGPFALMMMLVAPQSPRLVARFGPARVVALGMALAVLGLFFMAAVTRVDSSYWKILPIFLVMPAGMALTISPLTASIMSAVPLGRAGVGSALNDTTRELGGALGVAVLGSVVVSRFSSHVSGALGNVPAALLGEARSGLPGALKVADQLPGESGAALASAAKQSFMSGIHIAAFAGSDRRVRGRAGRAAPVAGGRQRGLRGARPRRRGARRRGARPRLTAWPGGPSAAPDPAFADLSRRIFEESPGQVRVREKGLVGGVI